MRTLGRSQLPVSVFAESWRWLDLLLFLVEVANWCAARDTAGVEADDVVAVEDCGAGDLFCGVGIVNT